METASSHLTVRTFRFRDDFAAEAEAVIDAGQDELWHALLDLDAFPNHVPAIDHATIEALGGGEYRCKLGGRIGVWKIGVPIEIRYVMRATEKRELELARYDGGVFRDVYFRHRIEPVGPGKTRLTSLYYFDLHGFKLLNLLKIFERFPWLAETLNLAATAMMVRAFQVRWETKT